MKKIIVAILAGFVLSAVAVADTATPPAAASAAGTDMSAPKSDKKAKKAKHKKHKKDAAAPKTS